VTRQQHQERNVTSSVISDPLKDRAKVFKERKGKRRTMFNQLPSAWRLLPATARKTQLLLAVAPTTLLLFSLSRHRSVHKYRRQLERHEDWRHNRNFGDHDGFPVHRHPDRTVACASPRFHPGAKWFWSWSRRQFPKSFLEWKAAVRCPRFIPMTALNKFRGFSSQTSNRWRCR
jgi:hypothetical protein